MQGAVHDKHGTPTRDAEEQDGCVVAAGLVGRPGALNLLLGLLSHLLLVGDLIAQRLGLGDDRDGALILQDVALGRRQDLQAGSTGVTSHAALPS